LWQLVQIPKNKHSVFLKDILEYVVDRNGLASIPKADMEACFLFFYRKHVNPDINLYNLSKIFKIKESKLKSLMELFSLKFNQDDPSNDDNNKIIFLELMSTVLFHIESHEKVEISFQFDRLEYISLLRYYFRKVKGAVRFNSGSEQVIVNQNRLYDVLDLLWEENKLNNPSNCNILIQKIIENIGESIDNEIRNELRKKPESILNKTLIYGSKLSSIGNFITSLVETINNNHIV